MKIVHLSDIHVWRYTWNVGRLVGVRAWWMLALLRGRARQFQLERLDEVVARVRSLDPDHVLITGDLTTSALPDEFADAKRHLAPMIADRERITILPGNHDRATRRSSTTNRFESAFGLYMPRLTFPWLRRLDDETAILGLDATRFHYTPRGRIPTAQLDQARALLTDAPGPPRRLIVASHYPIAAPPPYERELAAKRLENADELAAWLARVGPHIFCCGHVHAAWAFRPRGLPDQLCLNAGAPLYRDAAALQPPGFLEIDLDADRVKVVHQAWDGKEWKPIVMVDERVFGKA
ncbi:MAG: metallophosphoesterase [Paludisphaera borealis]|uniref:metallophosphoesterase family protein n=1 Tax=Paludisphaera borealis TaxID=1387353 RepID=UPI00283FB283|nr:metallophosphoesterase [Paludisphaera borealis]MDR3619709.1 metallophosphoesterase [Paludisphaera borealis]